MERKLVFEGIRGIIRVIMDNESRRNKLAKKWLVPIKINIVSRLQSKNK